MNKEFFAALEALEKEKGIPQDYMLEKVEAALVAALKKEYGNNTCVRVAIDRDKEDIHVYQQKTVVEVVENPEAELSLEDARAINKRYELGRVIETEVKPKNFRRLSAAAAKSVIIQSIREGERRTMQQVYESKREEIISAVVSKVDPETHRFASQADSSTFFLSIVMSVVFLFLLVYDLVWCKYRVFLREGHLITVFRGFFKRIVYVDGKERGRLSVTTVNFLDVWLNRSLRMTIVFSNAFWHLCHITYSDGSPTELI
jgi:hypothetical protein